MSVVVVGANHRTAPLDLLERMSIDAERLPKLLHAIDDGEHTSEVVVISTCNRTEVYLVAERFHGAYQEVRDFFADLTFLPPEQFADSLYVHYDEQAIRHLFEVAAGLDSAVPGEHEVLGQVRTAWETAMAEGTSRRNLNLLFRHALEVGKRARSETAIAQSVTSVSQAAVVLAERHLGSLDGRAALLVGAGSMGRAVAAFLIDAGVESLVLANRTVEAARDVLDTVLDDTDSSLPCDAVSLDDVEAHLGAVDLVITATGAGSAVIRAEQVEASLTDRRAPLLVVDIGVPRDVEPSVADLDGVELLDMQTVAALTEASLAERRREVTAVRVIVDDELQRFAAVSNAREVDPVVTALRQRADDLRVGELTRHASRLAGLDAEQRASVEHLTRSLVAKLLHDPTVRLKDAAGSSRGDRLAESIRDLFDLPDDARGDTGADPLDPDRLD